MEGILLNWILKVTEEKVKLILVMNLNVQKLNTFCLCGNCPD
jgi:hypothetical protein